MWRLRTFGGLSIESDGRAAAAATRRRPLALLALLAVAGERGLSREKVVALLWPESDEEHGRNSLSQALAALRRDAAEDDLVVGAAELRLNPSVITSDVVEFAQCIASGALERAVALYQGPFVDGFFVREAPDFERWADEHRRRLHDLCAATLERLARAADERSDHEDAVAWWRRLAALEPTSAQAASGLMRALATSGDRAAAHRHYRVYEELMRQELGVTPEPAVAALAASLFTDRAAPGVSVATTSSDQSAGRPRSPRELAPELIAIATPAGGARASVPSAARRRSLTRRVAIVGGVVAIAALAVVGAIAASRDRDADYRVVIRTFRNNSGDPALDPIGPMAADWIARDLAQTPSVVAGAESDIVAGDSSAAKTSALDPIALGRLIHARYVISGSHYTQGDSLFLQAEVWDAKAGRLVLSVPPVGDAIRAKTAVLERLRQRVTGALVPYFDSSIVTMSRVPPRYEAYEEFLLGDQLYDIDRPGSLEHLQAATRLDQSFIFARLRLISLLESTGAYAARDSLIAEVAAKRDSLSPYDRAAFDVRVGVAKRDYHGAYLAGASGWRLAPKFFWAAYEAGETALLDGRPNEAIRAFEAIDPKSGAMRSTPGYYALLCRAYHDVGRMRNLRRCYDQERRQYPTRPPLYLAPRALGALGDAKGVEMLLDSLISLGGDTPVTVAGVFELDAHGYSNDAHAIARRTLARFPRPINDSLAASRLLDARANLLFYLGEWRELAHVVDSVPQRGRSGFVLSLRGVASARLGDTADARLRAEGFVLNGHLSPRWDRARVLAALGDEQAALDLIRVPAPAYYWQRHDDGLYLLMRDYPPFQQFLKPRD